MAGRPTSITADMAERICESIITSTKSLRTICKELDLTVTSVMRRLDANQTFREQYARAKREQAEMMGEDMMEIADDGTNDTFEDSDGNKHVDTDVIQRSKLRVDTRKWLMSKLLPKKYGDKIGVEHSGEMNSVVTVMSEERRASLLAKKQQAISRRHTAPVLPKTATNGNGKNGHN